MLYQVSIWDALMNLCPHCQEQNRDEARFCGHCGHCGQSLASKPPLTSPPHKKSRWKTFGLIVLGIILVGRMLDFALYSDARSELEEKGIPFNEKQFLQEGEDGNTEVVELFLLAGIEHETSFVHLYILNDALDKAVRNNRTDVVNLLLVHGANPNLEEWGEPLRTPPLMTAAEKGYVRIVRALLDNGAYVNAKSYSGKTALDRAVQNSSPDIVVRLLKEAGARE